MKFVNNIITDSRGFETARYAPDKLIIINVLQNKLKCVKIQYDESKNVLSVTWKKEMKNG